MFKASEIWFMGCTGFIFGSLVEFAFVNTIWRRKKNVEMEKVSSIQKNVDDLFNNLMNFFKRSTRRISSDKH